MKQDDTIIEFIKQAIRSEDANALRESSFSILERILEEGHFPDKLFDELVSLIRSSAFQQMNDSFHLLKIFEDSTEDLSEQQKTVLLSVCEETYPNIVDSTSSLLISELIGALFSDERSLKALQRLKKVKNEEARALVASGLEHFAKMCQDQRLADRAKLELQEMQSDRSETVRTEVAQSLSRL